MTRGITGSQVTLCREYVHCTGMLLGAYTYGFISARVPLLEYRCTGKHVEREREFIYLFI